MSIIVKKGTFTKSTSGAPVAQTIDTGSGQDIKFLKLFGVKASAVGFASQDVSSSHGFSDGTTEKAVGYFSDNITLNKSITSSCSGDKILCFVDGTETITAEADVTFGTGIDAGKFTITWTTNDTDADIIHYEAYTGSSITDVKVGEFSSATGTGNQAVTGVGFLGEYISLMTASNVSTTMTQIHSRIGFGQAISSTARNAWGFMLRDDQNANKDSDVQLTDACLATLEAGGMDSGQIDGEWDFVSFDADGFTLNVVNAPDLADKIFYAVINGGEYDVGSFNQPAVTGTDTVTVGFIPKGISLSSWNKVADTVPAQDSSPIKGSYGAGTSSVEGGIWFEHDNKGDASEQDEDVNTYTDKVIKLASGPSTIDAEADFDSITSTAFVLDWTTADATAREVLYFAIGQLAEEHEFLVDGLIQALNQEETFLVDARLVRQVTTEVDARLIAVQTETFETDARLIATFTETFTVDARIVRQITFTVDARLIATFTEEFIVDTFIQQLADTETFTVDAFIGVPAVTVRQGTVIKDTGGAPVAQTIDTGSGIEIKFIKLSSTRQTSEGFEGTDLTISEGFSDGTNSRAISIMHEDGVNTTNTAGRYANKGLTFIDSAKTTLAECDVTFGTGVDAGKFTLTWTTNDAVASIIHFVAYGDGSETFSANVGTFTSNTVTGNQSITGVGFKGSMSLFLTNNNSVSAPNTFDDGGMCVGHASAPTERNTITFFGRDNQDMSNKNNISQRTDLALRTLQPSGMSEGNTDADYDFVSFDADGFTLNVIDAPVSATQIFYAVLKGGSYEVGAFNQPTSNGTQEIVTNARPIHTCFRSWNEVADIAIKKAVSVMTYTSSGADVSTEGGFWFESETSLPVGNDVNTYTDRAILLASGTSTIDAEANYLSTNDESFTLDWTATDATAREILYWTVVDKNFGTEKEFTVDARLSMLTRIEVDAFLQALNQEETFLVDAFLQATFTDTFTVDAFLQATFTETFTVNAILKLFNEEETFLVDAFIQALNQEETFTVDAFTQATFTETFEVDAFPRATIDEDFLVDAFLQALNQEKTFFVDAFLQATFDEDFLVDAFIQALDQEKDFLVDGFIEAENQKLFLIDAFIQALNQEKTFTVDSRLIVRNTKTFLVDARLIVRTIKTFTVHGYLVTQDINKTFLVDGLPQEQNINKTFLVDAFPQATFIETFLVDAFPRATFDEDFLVDGFPQATFTETFLVDAFIQALDQEETFTVDSIIVGTKFPFTVDGFPQATFDEDFLVDGFPQATFIKTFLVDAIIIDQNTEPFIVDGLLLEQDKTTTFILDSLLQDENQKLFLVDGLSLGEVDEDFIVDGLLEVVNTETFDTDAILKATDTETFTIDSILVVINDETFDINGLLQATFDEEFTIDSILLQITDETFLVDSILITDFTVTTIIDAELKKTLTETFEIDARIFKVDSETFEIDGILAVRKNFQVDSVLVRQVTVDVDSILKATLDEDFLIDSILFVFPSAIVDIDALLVTVNSETFLIDAVLAEIKIKDYTVNAFLLQSADKTFTLNAKLAEIKIKEFIVDARLLAISTDDVFTINAILKATRTCDLFFTEPPHSGGWTLTGNGIGVVGSLISGWGTLSIVRDFQRPIGFTLPDDSWTTEFVWKYTVPFTIEPRHFPFSLSNSTATGGGSGRRADMRVDKLTGLGIDVGAYILVSDGIGGVDSSAVISGASGVIDITSLFSDLGGSPTNLFYSRLEKVGTTYTLSFFKEEARINHYAGSPVTLVSSLNNSGLKQIHTGGTGGGNSGRALDGDLFDIKVIGGKLALPTNSAPFGCYDVDALLQQLGQSETFTVDARLIAFNTDKTFIVDGIVQFPATVETFDVNAILKLININKPFIVDTFVQSLLDIETFLVDAVLINVVPTTFTEDFTINALLKAFNQEETFLIRAIVFKVPSAVIDIGAMLQATLTETFLVDSILVSVETETFIVDAVLVPIATIDEDFFVDALIQEINNDFTFIVDGNVALPSAKTFIVDVFLLATKTRLATVNAILTKATLETFEVDAVILGVAGINKPFTINALLQATFIKDFQVDTFSQGVNTKDFFVDAIIIKFPSAVLDINAILKLFNEEETFTINANLRIITQLTPFVDSILKATIDETFFINALLQALDQEETFLVDAKLSTPAKFTVDAFLDGGSTDITFFVDAVLKAIDEEETFLVDAKLVRDVEFIVDGLIKALGDVRCQPSFLEKIFFDDLTDTSNWSSEINNTSVDGWDTQEIFIDGESVPSDGIIRATMKPGGFAGEDTPIFKTKYRRKLIGSEGGIGIVVDGSKVRLETEYTHIVGSRGVPIGLNKSGIHPQNDPNTSSFHINAGNANISLTLDSGLTSVQTDTVPVGTGIKRFVVAESIGNTVTLNVYSDSAHTSHVAGSPVFVDSSTVDKNDLNFSWVIAGANPKLSGPANPNTTVELDEIHIYASPCPVIKVDAFLTEFSGVEFTVGARLVRQITFNVDARLRGSANFTVDAVLSRVVKAEVDAILSPQGLLFEFFVHAFIEDIFDKQFFVNAILLRGVTFSVDAIFSTEASDPNFSLTHIQSIAHIFNGIFDKEFQIDALIRGSISVTVDARLVRPLSITVDAILSTEPQPLAFSLTHFQDITALLSIDESVTTFVNALLIEEQEDTFFINARLVLNPEEEFFIDAQLTQDTKTVAPFVDSLLKSLDLEEQVFVNSILVARNVEEPLVNAILKKFNVEKEFTISSILKASGLNKTFFIDSSLAEQRQKTYFVDAILKLNGEDGFCNFYPDTLTIGTGLEQFVGPITPEHESNVDLLIGQEFTLSNQQVKRARILLRSTGGITVPSVISGKIWRNVVKGDVAGEVVQVTSINTIDANISSGDLPAGVWTEVIFDFGGIIAPFLTGDFLIGIQHVVGAGVNDPQGVGVAQPVISGGNVIAGEALFRREDNSGFATPDTWKVLISDAIDMVIDLEIVNGNDIILGRGNQCPRVDSIVVDRFIEDSLVNAILINRRIETFTINAILKATDSEDILVNAILSPLKEFTVDAQVIVVTISNDETFIVDARLERPNQLKPFFVEAILITGFQKPFIVDGFFKKQINLLTFADAQIQAINQEETFTINAVLLLTSQPEVFVDGFLKLFDVEETFTITGALAITQPPVTFTIGAELNDEKERFRVDAQIVQRTDETFIIGARLTDAIEKEYFVDSIVKAVNTDEEFLVDTILTLGFQEPFLIGGHLSVVNSTTSFVNAILSKDGLIHEFTVNSILVRVGSFTVDGFKKALGDGILGRGNNGSTNIFAVNPFISQFTGTATSTVPVGTNLCGQRLRLPTSPVRIVSFSFKLHRDGLSGSPVGSMVGKIYRNSVAGTPILPADLLETSDNTVLISTLTTNPLTPDTVSFNFSTVEITPDDDIFIGIQLTGTNEEIFFGVTPDATAIVGGDFTTNAGADWGVDLGVDTVLTVIIDDEPRQRGSALVSAILGVRSKTFLVDGNVISDNIDKTFFVDGKIVFPKSIEFTVGAILIGSIDVTIGAFVGEIQETVLDVESVIRDTNSDSGNESTIGVGEA